MKRAFLTGENGFIAKNLVRVAGDRIKFINDPRSDYKPVGWVINRHYLNNKGEVDFSENREELLEFLKEMKCNLIIHNGAIVGTDVCGLHPKEAVINNVYGTFNIAMIAKKLKIPVVYLGTTVIYDTQKIQEDWIVENSPIFPRTLYASTKYEGELIIRAYCRESKYCILRPLFCYGGEGDMNSLIAKSVHNHFYRQKPFKIFLNPEKYKDYMHVDDFCEAIIIAATTPYIMNFCTDFNISVDDAIRTYEVADNLRKAGINTDFIKWVPETDYLGNHRVSNRKFRIAARNTWSAKIPLISGIEKTIDEIVNMKSYYNPFEHLDEIEKKGIDIETHYNFKG
jgi:nucleoside-diphosphate-sugar epimerase